MIYVHSFHKQEHHIFYLDLSFYQQDFHHTTLYPHIQYSRDLVRIQPPHRKEYILESVQFEAETRAVSIGKPCRSLRNQHAVGAEFAWFS